MRQKGRGIGSFFTSIFRRLVPIAQKYIIPQAKKYIIPHAKKTFHNIATDYLEGRQSMREAMKSHGMEGLKAAGRDMLSQSGSGRARKRTAQYTLCSLQNKRQKGQGKRKIRKRKSRKRVIFKSLFD